MNITLNGKTMTFQEPVTVQEALKHLNCPEAERALGCFCGGRVLELSENVPFSCALTPITYKDEEGRRIYERSLRFVFLMAVKRCFPTSQVRIEHSAGTGIYIVLEDKRLYPGDVLTLENTMRDIVKENLPFRHRKMSRREAVAYFESIGDISKARLLYYRPYDYFNVYECGGVTEYFYGAMLPSTGCVPVFSLHPRTPGLVMLLPKKEDPSRAADYLSSPKQMATFAQSNHWCRILECRNAADLNDRIARGRLRDFVRVNEALHDKSLSEIADDIVNRGARAIFIAGPSSSGKTTFANRLCIHLRVNGLRPVLISLDDFYRNRAELPLEEDGKPDLEALDALDVQRFRNCVSDLLKGRETAMPRFDFTRQTQNPAAYALRLDADQPLVFEGIHALNPAMHEGFDARQLFRVYISQLTCLNLDSHNRIRTTDARLLRRMVRDHQFRGTPPRETLAMWEKVRRGEEKWIFPYQENADVMFNSALHYELPVLKHFGFKLINTIPMDDPHYLKAARLRKILNYFLPVDEGTLREIPPLSILREFIGGNTLYTESK